MPQPQNVIAVVFDYDKTLSPRYMQEDAIFRRFGIDGDDFWKRCNALVRERGYETELAWMHLLLEHAGVARLSNADLRSMGAQLTLYPGLPEALPELRSVVAEARHADQDVQLEFYVVTSGLKEIVAGSALAPYLRAVFGCEYDERDGRLWRPRRTVSHTAKTQMLFRINKNLLAMSEDVNVHMSEEERRIPFRNMIYVGDGPTDVPSFAVVKSYGGKTLAVYDPAEPAAFEKCYELRVKAQRVHEIAEADYRPGTHLRRLLERMIADVAEEIVRRRA